MNFDFSDSSFLWRFAQEFQSFETFWILSPEDTKKALNFCQPVLVDTCLSIQIRFDPSPFSHHQDSSFGPAHGDLVRELLLNRFFFPLFQAQIKIKSNCVPLVYPCVQELKWLLPAFLTEISKMPICYWTFDSTCQISFFTSAQFVRVLDILQVLFLEICNFFPLSQA